ncbi:MAG: thermonuclease family protein [Acidobacteriota bacterium]|nr:thermonuclease family protein [Acidobacteriota bacterium]
MKLLITILLFCGSAFGQSFSATVTKILDGDTILVEHSDGNIDRVRMLGIDAPEVARSKRELAQPFAETCKKILSDLILGKTVMVLTDKRDGYGRNLARVIFGELDANLVMLTQGCAHIFYPNAIPTPELRGKYQGGFEYARRSKLGLFSQKRITTPAKWRARRHYRRK